MGAAALLVALVAAACGGNVPEAPTTPGLPVHAPPKVDLPLDTVAVIDALDYWQSAAGLTYVLVEENVEPRFLIRPGTDGLAPQGGGRAIVDGVYPDNRARSGLVVIEPGGGRYCGAPELCRYLYRHEIGHTLGFLGHSNDGLMYVGWDVLFPRELAMIQTLYGLPHGAGVNSDGSWAVASSGAHGQIADLQAARDLIDWNINAVNGAHRSGTITRWELPVRVYLQRQP